ncbi:MAG: TlpA family protein disulfide reductase [Rhodobacteraceae bacterium]|nr:TlpA family protein disulfide reductase [Paracoccaceae bacterium]
MHRRNFLAAAGAALAVAPASAHAYEVNTETDFGSKLIILAEPFTPPELPLLRADESVVKLTSFTGEVVVATFWATWCHVCQHEMPVLDKLADEMAGENVRILPLSLDSGSDALEKVTKYYKRRDIGTLEVILDAGRYNAGQFGIRGTPTTFFINKTAQVVGAIEGEAHLDSDEARAYLRHLAAA